MDSSAAFKTKSRLSGRTYERRVTVYNLLARHLCFTMNVDEEHYGRLYVAPSVQLFDNLSIVMYRRKPLKSIRF